MDTMQSRSFPITARRESIADTENKDYTVQTISLCTHVHSADEGAKNNQRWWTNVCAIFIIPFRQPHVTFAALST